MVRLAAKFPSMGGFWGNVIANLIGTFVGAGLALAIAQYLSSRGETMRDRRLVQSVIDRLHRSRALRPDQTGGQGDSPAISTDRQRCTESILTTRNRIAAVSDELSGRAKASGALDAMHLACLRYLSRVERDPHNYVDALMSLREALVVQVDALCASDKELHRRVPGGADLNNPTESDRTS